MSQPVFAFQRVAIVNRGEPAMRLINAVREWNAEGRSALRAIAVYTAADRHATFVREADEAVLIGPAEPDAAFAESPYLDYAELERALRACRADAVWAGWGTRSSPSCWRSRPACRSRRGAAARCPMWRRPARRRRRSATR